MDDLACKYSLYSHSGQDGGNICSMMYCKSRDDRFLDHDEPKITLRSNTKVKFKSNRYELYLNSPMVYARSRHSAT